MRTTARRDAGPRDAPGRPVTERGHGAWVAVAGIALLTLAFLWPAFVTGAPWAFADTRGYYTGGASAWDVVWKALGLAETTGGTGGGGGGGPTVRTGIRSAPYSMTIYAAVQLAGLWAPIVGMALATAGLVWLTARDLPARGRLALGAGLAAATALPFFAALFQPDAMTAFVLLIPLAIMLHADRLGPVALIGLMVLMAFATLSHYGNLPLALLALVWLGVWAVRRRRILVAWLAVGPIVAVVAVNVVVGLVTQTGPSLAPGRFPIILARSINDGPGHAYLTETCPTSGYTICEVYDEIPRDVGEFLWGDDSVTRRATPEQLARIGAEEVPMLLAILRYDPVGQIDAFLGNAVRQFFLTGDAEGWPARYTVTPRDLVVDRLPETGAPRVPANLERLVVLLGALALAWAAWRSPDREARGAALFLLAGLVVYAAVCGGLSAPVPRYQGRLVWLVPFLAVILLARMRGGGTAAR